MEMKEVMRKRMLWDSFLVSCVSGFWGTRGCEERRKERETYNTTTPIPMMA